MFYNNKMKEHLTSFFQTKCEEMKMKKFITFTFPSDFDKSDEEKIKLFRQFIKNWRRRQKFSYLWVKEANTRRNDIHFHLMLSINFSYIRVKKQWAKALNAQNSIMSSCYVINIFNIRGLIKYFFKSDVIVFGMSTNYYKSFNKLIKKQNKNENESKTNITNYYEKYKINFTNDDSYNYFITFDKIYFENIFEELYQNINDENFLKFLLKLPNYKLYLRISLSYFILKLFAKYKGDLLYITYLNNLYKILLNMREWPDEYKSSLEKCIELSIQFDILIRKHYKDAIKITNYKSGSPNKKLYIKYEIV